MSFSMDELLINIITSCNGCKYFLWMSHLPEHLHSLLNMFGKLIENMRHLLALDGVGSKQGSLLTQLGHVITHRGVPQICRVYLKLSLQSCSYKTQCHCS